MIFYHGTSKEASEYLEKNGFGTDKRYTGMSSSENDQLTFVSSSKVIAKWYAKNNFRIKDPYLVYVEYSEDLILSVIEKGVEIWGAVRKAIESLGYSYEEILKDKYIDLQKVRTLLKKHGVEAIKFFDKDSNNREAIVIFFPEKIRFLKRTKLMTESFDKFYFNEEQSKYQLYVDIDGVLGDFEKQFEILIGMKFHEFENQYGSKATWKAIENEGEEYWSTMPFLPEGKVLWNYVKKYNPIILSSPANYNESKTGKKIWVKEQLGEDVKLILESDKWKYANENAILIDDRDDNISSWINNDGIGILFKNAEDTIKKLKELGL
jgi:hypothetical protein